MRLVTYNSCTFQEKRTVLRTFWSGREGDSDKINVAAREYGPYALGLVAIISFELLVIAALLVVRVDGWAWLATTCTVLSLWSLWWTRHCQRHFAASEAIDHGSLGSPTARATHDHSPYDE
jgi:hypothetical protein